VAPGRRSRQHLRAGLTVSGRAGLKSRPYIVCGLLLLSGAACRQDMHDQPKIKAYREAEFFPDRRGGRPIPEGTIPRGALQEDEHLYTGKVNGQFTDEFPFQVTRQVLERGRDVFTIYCTPCHGQTGMGNGMVVQRGFRPPPTFHSDPMRRQAVGHWFDVMTNGFGAMPDYRAQVSAEDRWAVAAYIRALQLSQHATTADVPPDKVPELDAPPKPAAEPTGLTPHEPAH
jgi:mono/diheme cytochrome c family protein